MTEKKEPEVVKEEQVIVFCDFLESTPPSTPAEISEFVKQDVHGRYTLCKPKIQLHCSNDACNGSRFFRCTNENPIYIPSSKSNLLYLEYLCSNCKTTTKTFSLIAQANHEIKGRGRCYKIGEVPVYGPPTPSKLISLIGSDREIFLKGRRCENQGLGIGAFVYYRRVIENQKKRILDEIIKVSEKLNVDEKIIDVLKAAKEETQFKKSLEDVKDAIPQALLINGHNPFTLLHSALSNGLHDQSDEHCLEIASSIRVVLAELSERLAQALKDEAELNTALSRLMKSKK